MGAAGEKAKLQQMMTEALVEIDQDNDNLITLEEWLEFAHDPYVKALLTELELTGLDLQDTFTLLDESGDGVLSVDEFIDGLDKIKGLAKCHDVHRVQRQLRCLLEDVHAISYKIGVDGALRGPAA